MKGLRFTPYPKHILELKQNVENQIKKTKPNMDHIIYQGHEIMPNIDSDYKDKFKKQSFSIVNINGNKHFQMADQSTPNDNESNFNE